MNDISGTTPTHVRSGNVIINGYEEYANFSCYTALSSIYSMSIEDSNWLEDQDILL